MSDKYDYVVHKVYCEEINYELLILEIPKEELEDKLAYLATEGGLITKSTYDNYIMATCVANINQLLNKISKEIKIISEEIDLPELHQKIVGYILEYNPWLNYDRVAVNKNGVLKLKDEGEDLKIGEKWIKDNRIWNKKPNDTKTKPRSKKGSSDLKDINSLDYTIEKRWWKRIGKYVDIKKFNEEDLESLLHDRYFHTRTSFATFVVTACVVDFESLFQLLDNMGVPSRVAPPLLMHELYELCLSCNPFLTFDNAQDIVSKLRPESNSGCGGSCGTDSNNQMSTGSSMGKYANTSEQTKRFKDVPKEDLLNLASNMKVSLIGQDKAVDSLVEAIQRASVGLKDPNKPIGSFLFAGTTGCGKSLTAKVLAEELIKDKKNLITIDCSEYSADHEYSKLIGCFVPGTNVLMGDWSVKNIEDIKIGDVVITHLGNTKEVTYIHEYRQSGDMVEIITTKGDTPVITTKTHEIWCIKTKKCTKPNSGNVYCTNLCNKSDCNDKFYTNYKPEWVPASDVEEGFLVTYPKTEPKFSLGDDINIKIDNVDPFAISKDFMELVGEFIVRGSINTFDKKVIFFIDELEKDIAENIASKLKTEFDADSKLVNEIDNLYKLEVNSDKVYKIFKSSFNEHKEDQVLPKWVTKLPLTLLDSLVKPLLSQPTYEGNIIISFMNKSLCYQIDHILRLLGYNVEVSTQNNFIVEPFGDEDPELIPKVYTIRILDDISSNLQDINYQYFRVLETNVVDYTGIVYDLEVKDDTSYITEFGVHNSPAGYVGYEQGGILTNAVMKNPFSVVVFDEIEKASNKVYQLLLQVLDEGRLTDNKGNVVSFKDTVIILTSNIGVKDIDSIKKTIGFGDVSKVTKKKKDNALKKALKKKFKPEFLNRLDEVIYFNDLTKNDFMRIIDIELYRLNDNLQINDTEFKTLKLVFEDSLKKHIYKNGIDPEYGARPLKRTIEKLVATPLAVELLSGNISMDATVGIGVKKNKVVFDVRETIEDPPFYMSAESE